MIRSLVITPNAQPLAPQLGKDTQTGTLLRNHSQSSLEGFFAEGFTMWIDIVSPQDKEIRWLEALLQLSPTVVSDLLRED